MIVNERRRNYFEQLLIAPIVKKILAILVFTTVNIRLKNRVPKTNIFVCVLRNL